MEEDLAPLSDEPVHARELATLHAGVDPVHGRPEESGRFLGGEQEGERGGVDDGSAWASRLPPLLRPAELDQALGDLPEERLALGPVQEAGEGVVSVR